MIVALVTSAWAVDLHEGNVAATSVGVQHWQSGAQQGLAQDRGVKDTDTDVLLGQRIRWTLSESDTMAVRARVDARFTLGPGDAVLWERNRVRQLGFSVLTEKWSLDIGRHGVHKGGPRLVDGVQLLLHASETVDVGAWAGLAPDLFTTNPRVRPGGGPIVAYNGSTVQASFVGDFSAYQGLDRGAVLATGRISAARTIEVSGRMDLELIGGLHLADGQIWSRWAPVSSTRVDVFYNAFSSFRYQNSENLMPDVKRFGQRYVQDNPNLPLARQDCLDPKVAHVVGSTFAVRPNHGGVAPTFALSGRARFGPKDPLPLVGEPPPAAACQLDDINGFVRVNPQIGLSHVPLGGRLDLTLDANYLVIDGRNQTDGGLQVYWEPSDDGAFSIDTSYRVITNKYDKVTNPQGWDGLGSYADLFVDLVVDPADMVIGVGLNLETEPGEVVKDVGVGAYGRLTKYFRPPRTK